MESSLYSRALALAIGREHQGGIGDGIGLIVGGGGGEALRKRSKNMNELGNWWVVGRGDRSGFLSVLATRRLLQRKPHFSVVY